MRQFRYDASAAVAETAKGKIRGFVLDGVNIFKGIPYGKAERFCPPEETDRREGVFDASSFGYVCPLLTNDRPGGELLVPHRFWPMDEDCLNLNVWTPGLDDKKRPVLVWLHGGGFEAGSSIEHLAYEGENMARLGDAVVVTVNHRLNILGYFDLSDFGEKYENSGNAGNDDMILALRWVRDNIRAFGGDPGNVTLFGQSGGGAKITALLQTPEADGLFHKGLIQSGVIGGGLIPEAEGTEKELAQAMMEDLGLSSAEELAGVPYRILAGSYNKLRPVFAARGLPVGGAPHKNRHYLGDPLKVGFRSETKDIPLMIGSCFAEFSGFMPSPFKAEEMSDEEQEQVIGMTLGEGAGDLIRKFRTAYPMRPVLDLLNMDFIFRSAELEYIAKRSALNKATWDYKFNQDMPINGRQAPWHCIDVPYWFHNTEMVPVTWAEGTEKLENAMFRSLMAFARTGDPNNDAIPFWPASAPEKEETMLWQDEMEVRTNFDRDLVPPFAAVMGPVFMKRMQQTEIQH